METGTGAVWEERATRGVRAVLQQPRGQRGLSLVGQFCPSQHSTPGPQGWERMGSPQSRRSPPRLKPTVQARSRRFPVALSPSHPGASQGSALHLVPKVGPSPQHSAHPEASHAAAR